MPVVRRASEGEGRCHPRVLSECRVRSHSALPNYRTHGAASSHTSITFLSVVPDLLTSTRQSPFRVERKGCVLGESARPQGTHAAPCFNQHSRQLPCNWGSVWGCECGLHPRPRARKPPQSCATGSPRRVRSPSQEAPLSHRPRATARPVWGARLGKFIASRAPVQLTL